MRYLEKLTAEALRLAENRDPGKAFASLMKTLAAAGPVKMTLMDLLPPHDDDGKGPVPTRHRGGRRLPRGPRRRTPPRPGRRRRTPRGHRRRRLLLRALAHASDLGAGEAFDRALGIVLDGLGVPR
ncbi:hypothetical protein [Embleya sp. NPDC059237]|uniref:hypothetical protein n=1 Tax=Embleya sp. NPDC059237 TaxID=3346784 RepID=UPI0036BDCD79